MSSVQRYVLYLEISSPLSWGVFALCPKILLPSFLRSWSPILIYSVVPSPNLSWDILSLIDTKIFCHKSIDFCPHSRHLFPLFWVASVLRPDTSAPPAILWQLVLYPLHTTWLIRRHMFGQSVQCTTHSTNSSCLALQVVPAWFPSTGPELSTGSTRPCRLGGLIWKSRRKCKGLSLITPCCVTRTQPASHPALQICIPFFFLRAIYYSMKLHVCTVKFCA